MAPVGCGVSGVEHVVSPGPYTLNVIAPVGADPPARCAVSLIEPPTGTDEVAVVVSVGWTLFTTNISLRHVLVAAVLFVSPEYTARQ